MGKTVVKNHNATTTTRTTKSNILTPQETKKSKKKKRLSSYLKEMGNRGTDVCLSSSFQKNRKKDKIKIPLSPKS
jgi:hypothetical protein